MGDGGKNHPFKGEEDYRESAPLDQRDFDKRYHVRRPIEKPAPQLKP